MNRQMNDYKYILQPYKGTGSRFICPSCKKKEFARYIDTQTGNYVHSSCGRCNREESCGYHYTPKQYFQDNKISFDKPQAVSKPKIVPQQKKVTFIPVTAFKSSLTGYEKNNFINFLLTVFDSETVSSLVAKYFIGTSKHWPGSTIFWQIDSNGKIRTGKIMLIMLIQATELKNSSIILPGFIQSLNWLHLSLNSASLVNTY